jgi:hypothetical protein
LVGQPLVRGAEGQGGAVFDERVTVAGMVVARNLTPDAKTGKGYWTDGELVAAVRTRAWTRTARRSFR